MMTPLPIQRPESRCNSGVDAGDIHGAFDLKGGCYIFKMSCDLVCLKEQPKVDEMADKDDLGVLPKPAKRARTSFTVDQLQVMCAAVSVPPGHLKF